MENVDNNDSTCESPLGGCTNTLVTLKSMYLFFPHF